MFGAITIQYMIGLGDYEFAEGFGNNKYKPLLWIYFYLATMLTQIILFNTLIAILGDVYTMIMEKQALFGLITRTRRYSDFIHYIRPSGIINRKFVYIVTPEEDDEDEKWEG